MPRYNRKNIDRKTNKPNPDRTEGLGADPILNRADQTRRDDDVVRSASRTIYDIDYAIKWYIENEIEPQITANKNLISVPTIFANGEKWDNVRRLGYIRDEKGMLQSPLLMLKRNSMAERDNRKGLDVNRTLTDNRLIYRSKYNSKNRYEDELFPIPTNPKQHSQKVYVVDIPKYITVEYELMLWCDFTTQMNELVDQILPYGRFAWGNEQNRYETIIGNVSFETVNTVGEDRLVRATIPLTVYGTLLSEHETKISTLKKMYSVKKLVFQTVVDIDGNIFETTQIPIQLLNSSQTIVGGGTVIVNSPGTSTTIDTNTMSYLTGLSEKSATYVSATTVTISGTPKINPTTLAYATINEFDIYINGQYIDKSVYTWTPAESATQTIVFDTNALGFTLNSGMTVIVNGRWA
jgi:ribosomal protein S8E